MENITSIIIEDDLRRYNNAFIHSIKSGTTGITKRCICIPIDDNFIQEEAYVSNNGREIRTAKVRRRMWPVTEKDKADHLAKYSKEKKQDWNIRQELSKAAREALEQRDPALAARLNYRSDGFDSELARQMLPYTGVAYNATPQAIPPEQVETTTAMPNEGDDDLPF